jgi:hypothetical protein
MDFDLFDVEMEAKLENNNDERRILLERQVQKLVRCLCSYFCTNYMYMLN